MRWIPVAFGALILLNLMLAGAVQVLGKHYSYMVWGVYDPNAKLSLRAVTYLRLPFGLSGKGAFPGEVQVVRDGHIVIDEEFVEDVSSVRQILWGRSSVSFDYTQEGKTYRGELALEP